jgi:tRNA wybutosine-synthesizing protein 4
MSYVYGNKLNDQGERTRIEKIEMFDEFEEWDLLQSHYCLCLSVRGDKIKDLHI